MATLDITEAAALTVRGTVRFVGSEELVGAKQYHKRQVGIDLADGGTLILEFFGRDIPADIEAYSGGEAVEAEFQLSCRESRNTAGRWFTSLAGRALRRLDAGADGADGEDGGAVEDSAMPF